MARLLINTHGLESRVLTLRPGVNRIGRNLDADFCIDHSTVSALHCELMLSGDGILIRDCNSTNGTFVDGSPIKEALLQTGQTIHLGEVKLLVETAEVSIAIPKFQQAPVVQHKFPAAGVGSAPVVPVGILICPRHERLVATYKCKDCHELMCGKCVHVLKRKGGAALMLCPVCSGKVERINAEPPRKKTFMDTLRATVKMPLETLSGWTSSRK